MQKILKFSALLGLVAALLSFTSCTQLNRKDYNPLKADKEACQELAKFVCAYSQFENDIDEKESFIQFCLKDDNNQQYDTDTYMKLHDFLSELYDNINSKERPDLTVLNDDYFRMIDRYYDIAEIHREWYQQRQDFLATIVQGSSDGILKETQEYYEPSLPVIGNDFCTNTMELFLLQYLKTTGNQELVSCQLISDSRICYQVWAIKAKNYNKTYSFRVTVLFDENDQRIGIKLYDDNDTNFCD